MNPSIFAAKQMIEQRQNGIKEQERSMGRTEKPDGHKYLREIKPNVMVDVYDVLQAWEVKNPALQHLIKKALQAGNRGHKPLERDLQDILESAKRAIELETKG